ncbi:MAG: hypothetical protein BWY90_00482 [Deltaproteobacteria bacterium ADurb.BinA014]|nr:MAG: hypothetical protein BWY90_00482 [Deltaproteobacteria bacterium ADurb.BinA014]
MPRGVFAYDIEDRGFGAPRVMQIGNAVGKSRPQMQKRHCRFLRDASVAVSRAGAYSFKKTQHGTDAAYRIKRRHERQFCRPCVGKTYFYSRVFCRLQNNFRSGHTALLIFVADEKRFLSHPFPNGGGALAVADTHALHRVFHAVVGHFVHQRGRNARAGAAQRMTQRDSASFWVE